MASSRWGSLRPSNRNVSQVILGLSWEIKYMEMCLEHVGGWFREPSEIKIKTSGPSIALNFWSPLAMDQPWTQSLLPSWHLKKFKRCTSHKTTCNLSRLEIYLVLTHNHESAIWTIFVWCWVDGCSDKANTIILSVDNTRQSSKIHTSLSALME